MTGYGQHGPMADRAGHDINYISLTGALGASARQGERPLFPLNLLGDFGGGGMLLALGVVSGVLHARSSGEGQVIDVAMVDGAALLTTMIQGLRQAGMWSEVAGTNLLDSGAPFYEVYETSDGRHIAVGALEPQFHARLLELLEIPPRGDGPVGSRALARAPCAARRDVPHPHPGAVGRALRRRGRVRHPGARVARGRRSPARPGPQRIRPARPAATARTRPAPAPRFARTPAAVSDRAAVPRRSAPGAGASTPADERHRLACRRCEPPPASMDSARPCSPR